MSTGPEPKKKPFVERVPIVELMTLTPREYTVTITASGIVRAGKQTNLVAEVSGRITHTSNDFQEGSFFNKNNELLRIDESSYKNSLAVVSSDVAASRAALAQIDEEEKSLKRSYQLARTNLNTGKKELNRVRKLWNKRVIARMQLDTEEQKVNQLQQKLEELQGRLNAFKSRRQSTNAKINATLARAKQERLNISRTVIKAPYAGRILTKKVDMGQFVGVGTLLATIYATDYVEVDLPLSLDRYELLELPEVFKNKSVDSALFPDVTFTNPNSKRNNKWHGKVVRSSAALDANSRQITVIARVDNPFDAQEGVSSPLRIGQYIEAHIKGKTYKNVYVLPSSTLRQNKEILLLLEGKVHIVPVKTLWNTQTEAVVRVEEDIQGKQLINTSLGQATEGMKVISIEDKVKEDKLKENSDSDKKNNETKNKEEK